MEPVAPSWFKQRQGKTEPAGPNTLRLSAPQLADAFISIRRAENGLWSSALRQSADGPDVAVTDPLYDNEFDAWGAAFELYRVHVVT